MREPRRTRFRTAVRIVITAVFTVAVTFLFFIVEVFFQEPVSTPKDEHNTAVLLGKGAATMNGAVCWKYVLTSVVKTYIFIRLTLVYRHKNERAILRKYWRSLQKEMATASSSAISTRIRKVQKYYGSHHISTMCLRVKLQRTRIRLRTNMQKRGLYLLRMPGSTIFFRSKNLK